MTDIIEAVELRKSYGSLHAVDGASFTVAAGEFFGILGPNGAGKTTTLEIIEGLRPPDGGTVTLLGEPPWPRNSALLPRIGVQLQASSFFERLTAREQIHTFASLYGVPASAADEWLDPSDSKTRPTRGPRTCQAASDSGSSIACALVHDPEVVFLDEPTAAPRPAGPAQPLGPLDRDQLRRPHRRPDDALPR